MTTAPDESDTVLPESPITPSATRRELREHTSHRVSRIRWRAAGLVSIGVAVVAATGSANATPQAPAPTASAFVASVPSSPAPAEGDLVQVGGTAPQLADAELPVEVVDEAYSALARAEIVEQTTPEVDAARLQLAQLMTTEPETPEAPAAEDEAPAEVPTDATAAPEAAETTPVAVETAPTAEEVTAATAQLEAALAGSTTMLEVIPPTPVAPPAPVLPFTPQAPQGDYPNGNVPADALCPVPFAPEAVLRCEAADAIAALNVDYRAEFGQDMTITDSYRTYADQVAVKASRGHFAAPPGTSNHGFGVALDLGGGINSFGSPQYRWMVVHAGALGWTHPDWADQGGSLPEAWHWEYRPAA